MSEYNAPPGGLPAPQVAAGPAGRSGNGVSYNDCAGRWSRSSSAREGKPRSRAYVAANRGVRAVRALLWDGLASTEADESVWFSRAGWDALAAMREPAGSAQG